MDRLMDSNQQSFLYGAASPVTQRLKTIDLWKAVLSIMPHAPSALNEMSSL